MKKIIRTGRGHGKRLIGSVMMLPLVLIVLLALPAVVCAQPETRLLEVAQVTEPGTYLFSVGWDQGSLSATLIAPDGTRSTVGAPAPGTAVASREKIIIFKVEDASPGIWKIEFADDNNGRVGIVVQRLVKPLQVEILSAEQTGDNTIGARFRIIGEKNAACSYEAYLSLDGHLGGSRLIGQGPAVAGQTVDTAFTLNGVGSYNQYFLVVRAESSQGGFTDFDTAVSPAFSYINPAAPQTVRSLKAVSLPEGIEISWDKPSGPTPEGYVISAFDGGALPYHSLTVGAETLAAVIPPGGSDKITIRVAATADGLTGRAEAIEIDRLVTLESLLGCTLPGDAYLTNGSVDIPYAVKSPVMASVMINDSRYARELSGNGLLHLEMNQGVNHIRFLAKIDEQHAVAEIRSWVADTAPPLLRIYDDPDGQSTRQASWQIAGNADGAVKIIVNGKSIVPDRLSNFTAPIDLKMGKNTVEVVVIDTAGNSTAYEGRIFRIGESGRVSWLTSPWIIASIILLILAAALFIAAWRTRRLNALTAVILAVLLVLSSVSAGIGAWRFMSPIRGSGKISDEETQARAALEANLPSRAFSLASAALRKLAGDPELILLCARAACVAGDLAAADYYYKRISGLDPEEQEKLINAGQALDEARRWAGAASQGKDTQTQAVRELAPVVLQNISSDNASIKAVGLAVKELGSLTDAQVRLSQLQAAQAGADDPAWEELADGLEKLADTGLAWEASDLFAESCLARDDFPALLETLQATGAEGLVTLAQLVLDGRIPSEAVLAQVAGESPGLSSDEAWTRFLDQLSEKLARAARQNVSDAALLYAWAARLCLDPLLNHPADAARFLQSALDRFDPASGTGDPDTDRLLLALQYKSADLGIAGRPDANALADLAGSLLGQNSSDGTQPSETSGTTGTTETEPTEPAIELPEGLDGTQVRDDLQAFFNISAPEITEAGRLRLMVTMAAASQGFPGGIPSADDFEFRSNIGFRRLMTINSMTDITDVPRCTILLIDCRPFIPAETLALERQAALAYIHSKPAGEEVIVVCGGLPEQYIKSVCSAGLAEMFGNPEMECYLPTADPAMLEDYITAPYPGDSFSSPDLFHMISYPLSRMTAVDPRNSDGSWETTKLSDLQPWFGQMLVFTNGDPNGGVTAGGDKTIDFIRGGAITSNTAIHIIAINPVVPDSQLQQLAEAGRGNYINPAADDLLAFYDFVRTRDTRVLIADCQFPENPQQDFVDIWARHIPTGVIAGFRRNPGAGADLIGSQHYSDAGLSETDFSDYTGDFTDPDGTGGNLDPYHPGLNPGGDPFSDSDGEEPDPETGEGVTDVAHGPVVVYGPDRHTIARGMGGLVLITLNGQGFSGLTADSVNITIPGQGRIASSFVDITSDTAIRFFLPVSLPAGQYSLRVTIGEASFLFTDTFLIYDVDGVTTLDFGEWTITAAGMQRATDGSGLWDLSMARINDFVRFSGNIRITGDWLDGDADELTVTPESDATVSFDPDSASDFVQSFFIDDGSCLQLGVWHPFTLDRDGGGVSFSSRAWQDVSARPLSLGIFDFPYDTGTLFPDRIEVPVFSLNLDLPLMEFLLMRIGIAEFSASASALVTIRPDDLDLQMEAEISSDVAGMKLFSALKIKGVELAIDTSVSRISIGLEAELVPDKNIRATVALKGEVLDEIAISIDVDIPLTTTPPSPVPVSLTELGGGAENLADAFSGSLEGILGVTVVGTAKFEAGNVADIMPFVKNLPWLPADKVPPVLATDNTELRFRPWPFSLGFATDVKLFDAFPVGRAELSLGYYPFTQALLNISDDEAIGLHALLALGPDFDFKVARIGYSAGPSLDINNHGFFVQANGGAWVGVNLGIIGFTADMTGTFLIAVHDAADSAWPQLSIVANAAPSFGIPALWQAGEVLDVRLLINENGVRLVGIPSPIDQALTWLGDQITGAASETWDAVTDGMDLIDDAAGEAWDIVTETGSEIIGAATDTAVEIVSDGAGLLMDTGSDVVDAVDDMTGGALSGLASAGSSVVGSISSGISGFFS